jgi:hypothetical protein
MCDQGGDVTYRRHHLLFALADLLPDPGKIQQGHA